MGRWLPFAKTTSTFFVKKSQLLSLDYFISLGAMVFTLLLIVGTWQFISTKSQEQGVLQELDRTISLQSLALLSQSGSPTHWYVYNNLSDVRTIGLLEPSGYTLSMDRLFALNTSTFNASELQELVGFSGPNYNYYITAEEPDAGFSFQHGRSATTAAQHVAVREYVLHNGSDFITLRFGVWI